MPKGLIALLGGLAVLMLATLGLVLAMATGVFTPPGMAPEHRAEPRPEPAEQELAEARYTELEQALTVNLDDDGPAQYLEAEVEIATTSEAAADGIETHQAAIRDALMLFLADQSSTELAEPDAREALREEALDRVNATLREYGVDEPAAGVYFTRFVMQ
ncbi:MAG: flagellar basal body-associated FliL family protein [Halorhodospira halophila]|uniref:flagellar basal body-associated FliL family protein n=1 Tax=Halorhodospira halophila TaxID=1053 RepID=UPI0026EB3CBF|nr:flagellar basal body-associated FliL family protein [Halorhodospira halophila]MCC3750825.1 flagellar basal body-associated FliL family protein [Halorhodospira halophila]